MTPLSEKLDDVGWQPQSDPLAYNRVVFKWMVEATGRIEELTRHVENLENTVEKLQDPHRRGVT